MSDRLHALSDLLIDRLAGLTGLSRDRPILCTTFLTNTGLQSADSGYPIAIVCSNRVLIQWRTRAELK
ncbi:MAG: hypothetical protein QNJ46_11495 [Leptolyngbyaceae cyanobacterium MO_188.B28]|nr:hypothetical protein [Leptolyngbyaceae cyanobacterium MO_188.B28]